MPHPPQGSVRPEIIGLAPLPIALGRERLELALNEPKPDKPSGKRPDNSQNENQTELHTQPVTRTTSATMPRSNEALRKRPAPTGNSTIHLNDKTDAVNFEKSRKTKLHAQPKTHTLIIILPPPVNLHISLAQFTYMPGSAPTTAPPLQHSTQTSTWGYEIKNKINKQTCHNKTNLSLHQAAHYAQNKYLVGLINSSGTQFMHPPGIPFKLTKQPLQSERQTTILVLIHATQPSRLKKFLVCHGSCRRLRALLRASIEHSLGLRVRSAMGAKSNIRDTVHKQSITPPLSNMVCSLLETPALILNLRHEPKPTTPLTYDETLPNALPKLIPNSTTGERYSHSSPATLDQQTTVPYATGTSREFETHDRPTPASNTSATSTTYFLIAMDTFMELETQRTPTDAPNTPATKTTKAPQQHDWFLETQRTPTHAPNTPATKITKAPQQHDWFPFVRDDRRPYATPPPSNKVTSSKPILHLLGILIATTTFFMLLYATRILHLQISELYTRALFKFLILPLTKATTLLCAYTSVHIIRELSTYLARACLPGGFTALVINHFAKLPLYINLPSPLLPSPLTSFALGCLENLIYHTLLPLRSPVYDLRRFGRVRNGFRQGFLQNQHAENKAKRRDLNLCISRSTQHTYEILQSTLALLLQWPYVLTTIWFAFVSFITHRPRQHPRANKEQHWTPTQCTPPSPVHSTIPIHRPVPQEHNLRNNTCAARAVALTTWLLETPWQTLNNHAPLVTALRASDFTRCLNKHPMPPLQGETIQVPLVWFETAIRAFSITTGSLLAQTLLHPPSNVLIISAHSHAYIIICLPNHALHIIDPSPLNNTHIDLWTLPAFNTSSRQLASILAIYPQTKIELIALGTPTNTPLDTSWSRHASLTSILRGPNPVLFSFKDPRYSALSNMSLHNIIINGNSFRSVEHYFQSRKHLPHNKPHALSITLAPDAFFAKTLGRQRTALGMPEMGVH